MPSESPSSPSKATLDLLFKLIAFDTTSRNSNLALIAFVQDYLRSFSVESSLVYNDDGKKANLYATMGPADRGGILLSGHTDVVPVDGQSWSTDPFHATLMGSRIFGRGAADMKSFVATALAFVPEFARAALHTPIHLSLSYDEEIGCIGVRDLIDILKTSPYKPRMCIVGEPTKMEVVVAHKGKYYIRVHVRGRAGHSSLSPLHVNAIEMAAELIVFMRRLGQRIAVTGPFDSEYEIPHLTIMTGVIKGGVNLNIVPKECWFDFEIRDLPQDDPEAILAEIKRYAEEVLEPEMKKIDPSSGFSFDEVSVRPSLSTGVEDEIVRMTKALACQCRHGSVSFGTEAALFQKRGHIPSVVCGPGDIDQAHKADEFIELDQIASCENFMRKLLIQAALPESDGTQSEVAGATPS